MAQAADRVLGLLGAFRFSRGGAPVEVRAPLQQLLLARLGAEVGRPVGVDRLTDDIWGDEPPASNALQVLVSATRKTVGADVVRTVGKAYALDPGVSVDIAAFTDALQEVSTAVNPGGDDGQELLIDALSRWAAPFVDLPGRPWLEAERARLWDLYLSAQARLAGLRRVTDPAGVVGELRRLANGHPYHEDLRAQLVLALAASGRRAEALAEYEQARVALAEELGIDPGPELAAAQQAVLRDEVQAVPSTPAPPCHATNLLAKIDSFVGRDDDLAALSVLLMQHRMVTVTGFGGIGKTRLALHVATSWTSESDVWFVDLSTLTDADMVATHIAETAHIPMGDQDPADVLTTRWRDRPVLVVLDNLEQILDSAAFIADLLARTSHVRVLATSRSPLLIRGEHQYPLGPLAQPAGSSIEVVASVADAPAVRLFLDRARSVRPDFGLTEKNAVAVAAICRRLDGHPLAIELAAAHVKSLSPAELLTRLDTRLFALAAKGRDLPARHRSLQATIEWSLAGLVPEERLVLDVLALMPQPADLDVVSAVAFPEDDGVESGDIVAGLVDKSLARPRPSPSGATTYDILPPVAEYLLERLSADTTSTYQLRHADHIRLRAAALERQEGDVFDLFVTTSFGHVRAALATYARLGLGNAEAELVAIMGDFPYADLGIGAENLSMLQRGLELATTPDQRAMILTCQSSILSYLGHSTPAAQALQEAVGAARQGSDPHVLVDTLFAQARRAGDPQELDAVLAECEGLLPRLTPGSQEEYRFARGWLVAKQFQVLQPARAEEEARKLLGSYWDSDGRLLVVSLLVDRGAVDEAVDLAAGFPETPPHFMASVQQYRAKADAALAAGDAQQARLQARRALDTADTGDMVPDFEALLVCDAEYAAGDHTAALAALDQVLDRAADFDPRRAGHLRVRRAELMRRHGDETAARSDLVQALGVLPGDPFRLAWPGLLLALVEGAITLAPSDPSGAAAMLGCVAEHRNRRRFPLDLEDEAERLTSGLLLAHQNDFERGRRLDPDGAAADLLKSLSR